MASLGHIAVGMAAARIHRIGPPARWPWAASAATWSALSLLPDADVIGFIFGIRYEDEWGHRGATHSLAFALALGLVIGIGAHRFRLGGVRTGLIAGAVLLSHAVLDMFTNGGLGCALFWPFDRTRYFAPWNPIPVAPIGLYYFSPYGLTVAVTEALLFAPIWAFAIWPQHAGARSRIAALLCAWLVGVWLVVSGSQLRDATIGAVIREDTEYSSGYKEEAFRIIRPGQSAAEVRKLVGAPFGESWFYADLPNRCPGAHFEDDVVVAPSWDECEKIGVRPGVSRANAERLLGPDPPLDVCWRYTRSPSHRSFRLRMVCFSNDRVSGVIRRWTFAGS
jgi:inner membrane protein